jgi:hypothetical protein
MPCPLPLLAVLLAASDGAAPRARAEVIASAGKVTLRAERTPVNQILDRLARASGMKLTYEGTQPQSLVSIDVENVTEVAAVVRLMEGLGISYVLQTDATGERVASLIVPGVVSGNGSRVAASATGAAPPPPEPEEIVPAYDHIPLDPAVIEAAGGERRPDMNNPYMGLPVQHFPQALSAPPEAEKQPEPPPAPQFPQAASYPYR